MKLEELKKEIEIAFADVKLEDGIGYYEAAAIDDYLSANSKEYKALKAKDERQDWKKMLIFIRDKDHNFLDSFRYINSQLFSILLYTVYLFSLGRIFNHNEIDYSLFGYYFSFIDITHRSDFLVSKEEFNFSSLSVDFINKII